MTITLDGTLGVTFPAGGAGNPAGAVVGTTDTQTLTNKTLTAPTVTGTLAAASGTFSSTLAVTGITTVAAGSAALPSIISTTGTADTGQWFPAADTIAYSTAGTERMRIDSSGNVGIGTSAPAKLLSVQYPYAKTDTASRIITVFKSNDASNANELSISALGAATQASRVWLFQTAENSISNAGTISLQSSGGNVSIGGEVALSQLDVSIAIVSPTSGEATGVGSIRITNGTSALSSAGGLEFKIAGDNNGYGSKIQALNSGGSQLVFANRYATGTWTERMRIDSSGNLLISKSSTSLSVQGAYFDAAGADGSPSYLRFIKTFSGSRNVVLNYSSGSYVGGIDMTNTTTSFPTSSDERLKIDLGIVSSTDVIEKLKIHNFEWKIDGSKSRGVFAQEAYTVKPDAIAVGSDEINEDGNLKQPWSVDYSKFVPDLIVYCQELKAIIETLTARITALETE
jgi:hypothetical protein